MWDIYINVDITDSNAMATLEKYSANMSNKIDEAISDAVQELSWRIRARLEQELTNYGLGDSSLMAGIDISEYDDGLFVRILSDHVMFVEFGTGVIGELMPHPNPLALGTTWEYDVNEHGVGGWWYPTTEGDPNPSKRRNKTTGEWYAWTAGQESKPFMYNTWRYARRITTRTFNKHLKRALEI